MTLKDYTYFVAKFSKLPTPESSCTKEWAKFEFATCLDLRDLLGSSWEKFISIFLEKTGWHGEKRFQQDSFNSWVVENREFFLPTLAEFCEPLLVKSEKEKGA